MYLIPWGWREMKDQRPRGVEKIVPLQEAEDRRLIRGIHLVARLAVDFPELQFVAGD